MDFPERREQRFLSCRKLDRHLDALVDYVAAHPDATLVELVESSTAERGVKVCVATMWATHDALATLLNRSARTLPRAGKSGAPPRPA